MLKLPPPSKNAYDQRLVLLRRVYLELEQERSKAICEISRIDERIRQLSNSRDQMNRNIEVADSLYEILSRDSDSYLDLVIDQQGPVAPKFCLPWFYDTEDEMRDYLRFKLLRGFSGCLPGHKSDTLYQYINQKR